MENLKTERKNINNAVLLEGKEELEKHNIVTVFTLRHGETEYLEDYVSDEDKLALKGNYPLDLTKKGEETIRKQAKEIVKQINPENDVVVLWSSPAWRAQGSERIIKAELEKQNIPIAKDKQEVLLKNQKNYDQEYMVNYWSNILKNGKQTDYVLAFDFDAEVGKSETPMEIRKRAEHFYNWMRYITENIDLKGKRLVIISVSHFEVLHPITEDIFGINKSFGPNGLIKKGEMVKLNFDFDKSKKEIKISGEFRGQKREDIVFDKENRKFSLAEQKE